MSIWKAVVAFFFKRKQLFALIAEIKETISAIKTVQEDESVGGKTVTKEELLVVLGEVEDILEAVRKLLL